MQDADVSGDNARIVSRGRRTDVAPITAKVKRMKIEPSKIPDSRIDPSRRAKSESVAPSGSEGAGAANASTVAKGPSPAASIQIDVAAAIAAAKKSDKTSDVKLLNEIRAKIASGEFEIDYDKVAESILGDAIAASLSRVR